MALATGARYSDQVSRRNARRTVQYLKLQLTGIWHNIAYGINFDAGSVTLYHSTGGNRLSKIAGPIFVSASSNGEDWHLGVLRLPSSTGRSDNRPENWHFSGVYIESGKLTTSISG